MRLICLLGIEVAVEGEGWLCYMIMSYRVQLLKG